MTDNRSKSRRGLARLLLRLPLQREALRLEYERSPGIRELCEAYDLANDALAKFKNEGTPRAMALANDYETVIAGLQDDVLFRLNRNKN